jgi:23S rRNA pseudouridine1911/1915/1917 synthase
MNKNYKENLKKRYKSGREPIDNDKVFKIKKELPLLNYLTDVLSFSRNNAKALLSHHVVAVNGAPISQFDYMLVIGDELNISKRPIRRSRNHLNLDIIFENEDLIAIDKPAGVLSIATDREKYKTAYRMVSDYLQEKDKYARVFVVHRLDKETSGVILFAKNEKAKLYLQDNRNDLVKKRGYYAVVEGKMEKKEDKIINYIRMNSLKLMYVVHKPGEGSYRAITEYKVIKENQKFSLLDINIETGRRNQIRVTMGDLGHYVVGDDKYGEPSNPIGRLCLHAYELKFIYHEKTIDLVTKMPESFNKLVK